jgi:ABC-2 type transport system ATP-binding protein
MAVLRAQQVVKRFGATAAVDRVDLEVGSGEIYCLLGANGAGKTTLVNLFLGFLVADAGVLQVDGTDPGRLPQQARLKLAYIPEQVMLYPVLSGLENLQFFHRIGTDSTISESQARQALVSAGLPDSAVERRVATYSKGMRQKVGIAIAQARQAKALLLDEPTSGLDPQASKEFSQALMAASQAGVAVLTTTHDLVHAKQTAHRIGIMRAGRLVHELEAASISLEDLQRLYLSTMELA